MFLFSKAGIGVRGREIAIMLNVIMIYVVMISGWGREITVVEFLMPAVMIDVVLVSVGVGDG